jgi:hypothetical protein
LVMGRALVTKWWRAIVSFFVEALVDDAQSSPTQ